MGNTHEPTLLASGLVEKNTRDPHMGQKSPGKKLIVDVFGDESQGSLLLPGNFIGSGQGMASGQKDTVAAVIEVDDACFALLKKVGLKSLGSCIVVGPGLFTTPKKAVEDDNAASCQRQSLLLLLGTALPSKGQNTYSMAATPSVNSSYPLDAGIMSFRCRSWCTAKRELAVMVGERSSESRQGGKSMSTPPMRARRKQMGEGAQGITGLGSAFHGRYIADT
ncbi:hypothetical protein GGTG_09871 [Gaeumannomyces tritici R3-111a-1]|uniref:Uncharacterized protein n=1 Tax=Gaeumannomyces tritici (strain R3-111a-1) TaxID=644352 RepID=J3P8N6_GAET3|nr:hypothetical protein GGTG_09871 [Gaeumannomyces tritici R3-111a-1]EJT73020.1 hypothetical protein GGTG_09871 [Gaeumannomyces tritici R3-111a-1]